MTGCDGCRYWKEGKCIHTNPEETHHECEKHSFWLQILDLKRIINDLEHELAEYRYGR